MFDIKFAGYKPSVFHCALATIPIIVPSEQKIDRYTIPYRDGDLLGSRICRGNAHIQFKIHMKYDESRSQSGGVLEKDAVKGWLSQKSQLFIYKDANYANDRSYFEVLNTVFSNEVYKDKDYWRIDVDMEVYPFEFLMPNSAVALGDSVTETIRNHGEVCKPTYQINSNAGGNLTVNGYNFVLTARPSAQAKIVIDTRRKIAYNPVNNVNLSSYVSGDYEKLWLIAYDNNSVKAPAAGLMYLNEGTVI